MNDIIVTMPNLKWNQEPLKYKYNWLLNLLGNSTNKSSLNKDYNRAALVII